MPAGNNGTVEFSYADPNYGTHKLRFTWAETLSSSGAGATSTITVSKMEMYTTAYGGYGFIGYLILEVNGEDLLVLNGQGSVTARLNDWREVSVGTRLPKSTTTPIAHNSDGTKSVTFKLKKLSSGGYVNPIMYCPPSGSGDVLYPAVTFKFTDNDSKSVALTKLPVGNLSISAGANSSITVKRGGTTIPSGTALYYGDVLTITASADDGYRLTSLKVNGTAISSGDTWTVTGATTVTSTAEAYGASDFTVSGGTMGSPVSISIQRANSSFTHTLTYRFSGDADTAANRTRIGSAKFTGTSVSWTPDANALGAKIPTASSGTWVLRLETYSGSTLVGTTVKNITLSVPSDAAPTVASGWSSLSYTNTGTAVDGCGACVKGYSILRWVLDVSKITLKYGATLASVKAVCGGTTQEKTASGTYSMGTAASVSNSMTVTVTDSRGKKTSGTFTRAATDYAAPGFSGASAYRSNSAKQADESGTYITARAKAVVSAIGSGWNTATLTAAVKAAGGSYGTAETIPDNTLTLLSGSSYLITKSYVVKLTVTDRVGNSAMLEITVPTAEVAFNIRNGGKGAAFGKYAEHDNALDTGDWNVFGRVLGLGQARASIPANADLDDYAEPGVYGVTNITIAASLANCPTAYAGTLRVWNGNGSASNPGESWYYVVQEYTNTYTDTWRRYGETSGGTTVTWHDWSYYAGQLSVLKSNLGLDQLLSGHSSIGNGSTVNFAVENWEKGAFLVVGVSANAFDVVLFNVGSSGATTAKQVLSASGITVTTSTRTVTIKNTSGYVAYALRLSYIA